LPDGIKKKKEKKKKKKKEKEKEKEKSPSFQLFFHLSPFTFLPRYFLCG